MVWLRGGRTDQDASIWSYTESDFARPMGVTVLESEIGLAVTGSKLLVIPCEVLFKVINQ
ncbi:hypothetical protein AO501_26100 [Mycobacterium gordonae]|uniref:Uncharacterized protein n=1 Tax=Mycobacterium gordonae TaxID=1778 RepID=A0A0Q2RA16_MYCGO|nr:hypothetical protein AO501_26100 [Mycobacterium gordonae]